MSTHALPVGVTVYNSDSEDNANTVVERDSSGNFKGKTITATTALKTTGGLTINSSAKSSTFSPDGLATHYVVDTSGGSVTANLPAAASSTGMILTFVKTSGSNTLTLDGNSSETVGGATTKAATAQYATITIWCDGSAWHIQSTIGTWS